MLVTNGTVLTFGPEGEKQVISEGAVYYEGDVILDVGPAAELKAKYPQAETLDAAGKLILPGNICAHTHFYGAFARGMAIPGEPPANFMEILERLWWKLDRALRLEDCQASAEVALVDAIRHGTTTLIDHHASPEAIDGSLDALAEAVLASGLRVSLCYEVTDRNGPAGAKAGIAENVRWLKKVQTMRQQQSTPRRGVQSTPRRGVQTAEAERLGASFGLHASLTLSNQTLEQCLAAAADLDTGFHIHLAEDEADEQNCLEVYHTWVADRLEEQGILGEKTLAAHAIHLDEYEMDILSATKTKVSCQPRSNMNNAVGVAPIEALLEKGITVGLGNDGFSNNMFTEMAVCYLLHKNAQGNPQAMGAETVLRLAYVYNAQIARLFFPKPVGALTPGAYADLILLDYHPYTLLSPGNYPWHTIFGLDGSQVTHTICAGRLLMKDRLLLTMDEAAIAARARALSQKVWERVAAM